MHPKNDYHYSPYCPGKFHGPKTRQIRTELKGEVSDQSKTQKDLCGGGSISRISCLDSSGAQQNFRGRPQREEGEGEMWTFRRFALANPNQALPEPSDVYSNREGVEKSEG